MTELFCMVESDTFDRLGFEVEWASGDSSLCASVTFLLILSTCLRGPGAGLGIGELRALVIACFTRPKSDLLRLLLCSADFLALGLKRSCGPRALSLLI